VQDVEVIAAIKRLLVEELEVEPDQLSQTDTSTPLLGLGVGLDSIEALRLATALERHFDIQIPDESLTAELFANVNSLAAYVCRRIAEQRPLPEH
jgi:acyl carrier protein